MTWNNTSPSLSHSIAADIADILENFQHSHDSSGNLADPSGHTISFPTNNAGDATFMVGDSGTTTAWFYLNTAPTGWKVSTEGADSVLAVVGGSAAYNTTGGRDSVGTWTQPDHVHAGPAHTHSMSHTHSMQGHTHTLPAQTYQTVDKVAATSAVDYSPTTGGPSVSNTGTSSISNTGSAGGGDTGGGATASSWRPQAAMGKLFILDEA